MAISRRVALSGGVGDVFTVYGRDASGVAHVVDVVGFEYELFCDYFQFDALRECLIDEIGAEHIAYVHTSTVDSLYGYNTQSQKVYRIGVKSIAQVPEVKEYLETLCKRTNLQTYNMSIDPIVTFMNRLKIQSWLSFKGEINRINGRDTTDITNCNAISIDVRSDMAPLAILSFDIECISESGAFPVADKDPIIQIGNVLNTGQKDMFMLRNCRAVENVNIHSFTKETDMLQAWSDYVLKIDPDVITGFYICGFDIDYVLKRMQILRLFEAQRFGRGRQMVTSRKCDQGSKQMGTLKVSSISCPGRIIFDMHGYIFHNVKLRSYSLNFVSEHYLKERKEDVDYSQIKPMFNGSDDDRQRLVEYCIKDATLPIQLMDKTKALINVVSLSRVCGVPIDYILHRGQQVRMLSLIGLAIRGTKFVIPDNVVPMSSDSYVGAIVLTPVVGFHNKPIVTLDYASLYPSIMIANNLCYTTLLSPPQLCALKDPSMYVTSPAGYSFASKSLRRGLLPEILERLLSERARVREMMSTCSTSDRAILDGLQNALKVTANSMYGFTGALKFGKLPCRQISSSVTAFGRQMLKKTKDYIHKNYPDSKVIYGDTDSVMIDFNLSSVTEAMERGQQAADSISAIFCDPIKLQFEKIYFPYLLVAKKRYTGVIWTKPDTYDRIDFKGVEIVRRDNCKLIHRVMLEVVNLLLLKQDLNGITNLLNATIDNLHSGEYDLGDLIISKSYSKENYEVTAPHVAVVRRMQQLDANNAPKVGDRVPYIITKTEDKKISDKARHPIEVCERELTIDVDYYVNNQLMGPVMRLLKDVKGLALNDIFKKRKPNYKILYGVKPSAFDVLMKKKIKKANFDAEEAECQKFYDICSTCQGDQFKKIQCRNIYCEHFFVRSRAVSKLRATVAPDDLIVKLSF